MARTQGALPKRNYDRALYASEILPADCATRQRRENANNFSHSLYFNLKARDPSRPDSLSCCGSAPSQPVASSASRKTWKKAGKSARASPVAIVEDDENQQRLIKDLLEQTREFVCVGCYSSGEEALAGIPAAAAKLVLMDLRLPGMSGLECGRRLKAIAPGLKIIALTGLASEASLNEALRLEFAGYLTKPFSQRELVDALKVA